MKHLTHLDRQKRPYVLLHDPQTGRAAAYTNNHRLIAAEATKKLIEYALANQAHAAPFDPSAHDDAVRQLPAWAQPQDLPRMQLVWIRRPTGDAPDEDWLAIPAA